LINQGTLGKYKRSGAGVFRQSTTISKTRKFDVLKGSLKAGYLRILYF
jgi:hypothetical protein